jgi:hypothetical protein
LLDYSWLLETKLGLTQEIAAKVVKGHSCTSMIRALTLGMKSGEAECNEQSQTALASDEALGEEEADIDPKEQEEITQLEQKLSDLQAELALPRSEFEQRLMRRLREEV